MKITLSVLLLFLITPLFGQQRTAEEWLDSGYESYTNGDYGEAIVKFQSSIKLDGNNPETYYLMGVCQSQLQLNLQALKNYDKALSIDPNYAEVHYEKGYSLFSLNRYKEAIESFDKAIEIRPNYAEAWFNRGSVKCILGDKEGAEKDWEQAAELGASIPDLECE